MKSVIRRGENLDIKEKLDFLIRYHTNLCEQIKSRESFTVSGLSKTINKARKVEKQIEYLLDIEEEK